MKPVAVLGDASVDVYLRVDDVSRLEDKVLATPLGRYVGGIAANFAACLGRLGQPVFLVGRLGDDAAADEVLADLAAHGVDTARLVRQKGGATGYTVVLLDRRGERFIVVVLPEGDVRPTLDEDAIAGAAALYVSWKHSDLAEQAVACARRHGVPVISDVEAGTLARSGLAAVERADWVFFNQEGLMRFAPGLPLSQALRRARALGPRLACVTLGAAGCLVQDGEEEVRQAGFPAHVVDATGAGDCFLAAFTFARLRRLSLGEAARFATAASAISVTRMGPHQGAPTYDETMQFLAGGA